MATPSKQELDRINSLLDEVQKKYDQLGKTNPFKSFDTSQIKDSAAATKQLEVSLKGVNTELRETNDEFSNTFKSLQSIVNELTNGKVAVNKITNSTRTLEDVSSKILAQKNKGIRLDARELQSLQKKADISFTNLKQQKGQIESQRDEQVSSLRAANAQLKSLELSNKKSKENLQKEKEANIEKALATKNLAESQTRLGNINSILNKSSNFQNIINKGLKNEILDRKTIESSVGITGGLLTSLSKVTGITGVFDINQIKAEAEQIAEDAIDAFRQVKEYGDEEIRLGDSLEKARTELLKLSEATILSQEEIDDLNDSISDFEKQQKDFKFTGDGKADKARLEFLKGEIESAREMLEGGSESIIQVKIKGLEESIEEASTDLDNLNASARGAANSIESQFKILGNTISKVFDGLGNALKSPEAIFTALVALAGQVNSQTVDLGKSLNISYGEAQNLRAEFAEASLATGETFVNTKKLVEAQLQYNEALGIQGEITAKNAITQSKLTGLLGVSVETASKLRLIAEATGVDFEKQKLAQYETINSVEQQVGASINVKQVMEEVGKAGAYGLAQFQGSVVALTEGVAQAKALGLSLDQVNSIAGKLLDFESSINAELTAELLLGKDINLEKARLAALNNDQVTLMEEINREMGDFNDFSNMNRIQQEAMADAIGMSVDGLSESLLLQQYGEKTQKEITDLAGEEVASQVEKVKTQEAFNNAIESMKGMLADLVAGPLGTFADLMTTILSSTTAIGGILGVIGGVQIVKAISGFGKMLSLLKGIQKTAKSTMVINAASAAIKNPFLAVAGLAAAGVAVAGVTSLVSSATSEEDDFISPGYGKRTLSSPEGTVAFNDKDTIVAGTNLEQNSVINNPTTNSMVSNNTTTQTAAPANNSRMESELSAIKRVLENIATKEGTVSMNGTKFGTVTAMNTYQIQ